MFDTLSDRLAARSRTCAARAAAPRPTSTPPPARSGSRCSRPTSRCPSVRDFIAAVRERARGRRGQRGAQPGAAGHQDRQRGARHHPRRRDPPAAVRQDAADGDHARRPAGRRQDHAGRQARPLAEGAGPHAAARRRRPPAPQRRDPAAGRRRAGRRRRCSRPSRATASATRSRSPATRSPTPGASCTTSSIVDTAGRLGIDAELMQQAADIRDAVEPDEILFVVDAMIGQDAVTTAQAFLDGVGFDGVVLPSSTATPAVVPRCRSPRSPAARSCSPPTARSSTTSTSSTPTGWPPASSAWATCSR